MGFGQGMSARLLILGLAVLVLSGPGPAPFFYGAGGVLEAQPQLLSDASRQAAPEISDASDMHAGQICREAGDDCTSDVCCPAATASQVLPRVPSAPDAKPFLATSSLTEVVVPAEIRPPISRA